MPAGIEIINTHGTVLIDDRNPCLQLRAKYEISVPATPPGGYNIDVPNCVKPLFAIRPVTPGKIIYHTLQNSSSAGPSYRFLQIWQANSGAGGSGGAASIILYHFDAPVAPVSNHGLQVFDSAGNCTFDAMGKTAVVVDDSSANKTVTPQPGRQLAFCSMSPYRRERRFDDSGGEGLYTTQQFANGAALNAATGALVLWPGGVYIQTQDYNPPHEEYDKHFSGMERMLVLDVTNY